MTLVCAIITSHMEREKWKVGGCISIGYTCNGFIFHREREREREREMEGKPGENTKKRLVIWIDVLNPVDVALRKVKWCCCTCSLSYLHIYRPKTSFQSLLRNFDGPLRHMFD
jgi:hypothetical protein